MCRSRRWFVMTYGASNPASHVSFGPRWWRGFASKVDSLADTYKHSAVGQLKCEAGKYLVVIYSSAESGEASSRPHLRPVPFREAHYTRMVKAILRRDDDIPPDYVFLLADGKVPSRIELGLHVRVSCLVVAFRLQFVFMLSRSCSA